MHMIYQSNADVANLEPEDIYLGGKVYNLEPFVREEYGELRSKCPFPFL